MGRYLSGSGKEAVQCVAAGHEIGPFRLSDQTINIHGNMPNSTSIDTYTQHNMDDQFRTFKKVALNVTLGATFNGLALLSMTLDPTGTTANFIKALGNAVSLG